MNPKTIATGIAIGGQPQAEDIEDLKAKGYKTIVSVRTPQDDGYLPEEERLVENAGLNYSEIAISPKIIDDIAVGRFSQALVADDAAPVYVHCGSGGRAGLMVLLHMAIQHGWTVEQALEEGQKQGIAPSETSSYRTFFEDYIRRHSAGER